MTNPNCNHIKAVQKLSYEKAAHKILGKLTPGVSMDCERAKGKSKRKEQKERAKGKSKRKEQNERAKERAKGKSKGKSKMK